MEALNSAGLLLGSSWASGVNMYLTIAGLGIAHRAGMITLPGEMDSLSHLVVIIVAIVLYAVEFFADKIPYVDSAWDTVHTFIRPFGGAAMGFLAMSEMGPAIQVPVALLTGSVAMDSHLTKATARVAINTSPEPITNSVASVTEDVSVAGVLFLIMKHPIIAAILVILFILFSIWFLKKMFRFLKKVLGFLFGKHEEPATSG
ncbi:DUF4126 domain-containing protein [Candidatus Omnitrophota bacterium]